MPANPFAVELDINSPAKIDRLALRFRGSPRPRAFRRKDVGKIMSTLLMASNTAGRNLPPWHNAKPSRQVLTGCKRQKHFETSRSSFHDKFPDCRYGVFALRLDLVERHHPGFHVVIKMAVEHPSARIIGDHVHCDHLCLH